MKKYITPAIEVLDTEMEEMICASLTEGTPKEDVEAEAPEFFNPEDILGLGGFKFF